MFRSISNPAGAHSETAGRGAAERPARPQGVRLRPRGWTGS